MRAFDIAWPQANFSAADAKALVKAGHAYAIIGRQRSNAPNILRQVEACRLGGVTVIGEYLESMYGTTPAFLPTTRFVAVAVEPNSGFLTKAEIDAAGKRITDSGRVKVLYGNYWSFNGAGLLDVDFAAEGWVLWNAKYDNKADTFRLPQAFCGFTSCVVDQFSVAGLYGAKRVPGLAYDIDLDNIDDAWLASLTRPAPASTRKPPPAGVTDWASFYANKAEPYDISTKGLGAGYEDHRYIVKVRRKVK